MVADSVSLVGVLHSAFKCFHDIRCVGEVDLWQRDDDVYHSNVPTYNRCPHRPGHHAAVGQLARPSHVYYTTLHIGALLLLTWSIRNESKPNMHCNGAKVVQRPIEHMAGNGPHQRSTPLLDAKQLCCTEQPSDNHGTTCLVVCSAFHCYACTSCYRRTSCLCVLPAYVCTSCLPVC